MAHTKYHTEGLIVKSYDYGEKDVIYQILTRNYGLIYARAKGIRSINSKLRMALQIFSHVHLSLLNTADRWKITNGEIVKSFLKSIINENSAQRIIFLARILGGEEQNVFSHDAVMSALYYIDKRETDEDSLESIEILTALRLLNSSGYLSRAYDFGYLLSSPIVNDIFIKETDRIKKRAIPEINRTLRLLDV